MPKQRSNTYRLPILILISGAIACAVAQAQDTDIARQAFSEGSAAFAQEDFASALDHFRDALDAGMSGPAVRYNIAVSHYRLGQYDQAGEQFAYISEHYPAMRALAEYNLGLVARRTGRDDEADAHFRRALESEPDEKIYLLAERQLVAAPAAEQSRWYGLIETEFGHDDNVRLIADDVPLSGGTAPSSNFSEFMAVASGPISNDPGFRFDATLYSIRYDSASFFDQNFARLGFVYQWRWSRWLLEAGPHWSHSSLDGDTYEQRAGAGVRLRRRFGSRLTFGARLTHDTVDAGSDRFSYLDGDRDWLELRVDRQHENGQLTVALTRESNDQGFAVASARDKLALRYRHVASDRWQTEWEASLRNSDYDGSAVARDEDLLGVSVDVRRHLPNDWSLDLSVALSDNDSDYPYAYERTRYGIGFSKTFF